MNAARVVVMFFPALVLLTCIAVGEWFSTRIKDAPDGYQDETGFHFTHE